MPFANGASKVSTRELWPSVTYSLPCASKAIPLGLVNWDIDFPYDQSPPFVKSACPMTRSAVLLTVPATRGKRSTRLLPPSATHMFPFASNVTAAPDAPSELKQRLDAVGLGRRVLNWNGTLLQYTPEKSS